MLGNEDLVAWFEQLRLPESSRSLIRQIRSSDPARRVGGGRYNVSGRYPSRKMGLSIQFESHRVELAAIYEFEHDPDVLEYWDQPPSFKLEYKSVQGKRMVVLHTPDYFVIRARAAGWEECKTEEELARWAARSPNRYVLRDGRWHCPPGEIYAKEFGFTYGVRSASDINWVYQRNIQFLEDYLRTDPSHVSAEARNALLAHVSARPGVSLQGLIESVRGVAEPDDIYILILRHELYVDLYSVALAEPSAVPVFLSRSDVDSNIPPQRPMAGGLAGAAGSSDVVRRLREASPDELQCANDRFRTIRALFSGAKPESDVHLAERTRYRWMALFRKSQDLYGNGYVGLLPQTGKRGNRTDKLPEATEKLMMDFISSDYEDLRQKSVYASWATFRIACHAQQVLSPSYETFRLAVRARAGHDQTTKRAGPRAAYPKEPFYWELELKTPRHGDRPFEIGHIDHTELDIELVCSVTGRNLGRPWLSLLTDAFSRRVLAAYLSFDPPSYRACMMVVRECVSRHSRIPQIVVVDGGAEFGSVYFETLLARYECVKKTRPATKARFGSVIERFFGTCNSQFIHNLQGNTQIMRNVRQTTKSISPKQQAVWTLSQLNVRLSEYFHEIYDVLEHPALGQSPRQAFDTGLAITGERQHRLVNYDREFLILTLPTTAKGSAMVIPGVGVKIRYIYYWCDLFRDPEVERQKVPVRYDPFDAGTAFAFVKKHWAQCHSEYYAIFRGRSEREITLATQELRRQRQLIERRGPLSAKKLGEFLRSVEAEELLLNQRLCDQQAQRMRPQVSQPLTVVIDQKCQPKVLPRVVPTPDPPASAEKHEIYGAF